MSEQQHQTETPAAQPLSNEQPATGANPAAGSPAEAQPTPSKKRRATRKSLEQSKPSADPSIPTPFAIPPVTPPPVVGLPSLEDRPPSSPGASVPGGKEQPAPSTTITHEQMLNEKLTGEEIEDKRANRDLRDQYARRAYSLASGCIGFWIIIVSVHGTVSAALGKPFLSDNVLIAITTGVTVNVLAAFLGVIKGLFPTVNTHTDGPRQAKSSKQGKRGK